MPKKFSQVYVDGYLVEVEGDYIKSPSKVARKAVAKLGIGQGDVLMPNGDLWRISKIGHSRLIGDSTINPHDAMLRLENTERN